MYASIHSTALKRIITRECLSISRGLRALRSDQPINLSLTREKQMTHKLSVSAPSSSTAALAVEVEGHRQDEEEELESPVKSSLMYVPPCTALSSLSPTLSTSPSPSPSCPPPPPTSRPASLLLSAGDRDREPYASSERMSSARDRVPLDSIEEVDTTRTACPSCSGCDSVMEVGRDGGAATVLREGDWLERRVDAAE